jgi:hypothetical protein
MSVANPVHEIKDDSSPRQRYWAHRCVYDGLTCTACKEPFPCDIRKTAEAVLGLASLPPAVA